MVMFVNRENNSLVVEMYTNVIKSCIFWILSFAKYMFQMVHYHSSGFRLNPNLYECGKVCLSLLNTWTGGRNEMWVPNKSTMLQVLVSIQALILNTDPFFNEPGYEKTFTGSEGRKKSKEYSEDIFIKSLKKMMYTLRNPPQVSYDCNISLFLSCFQMTKTTNDFWCSISRIW